MTFTHASVELPRVLVLAADEITTDFSTGITVANLFKDWPRDRLSQVCLIPSTGDAASLTPRTAVLRSQGGLFDVPVRGALRTVRTARKALGTLRSRSPQASSAAASLQPTYKVRPHASLAALLELGPIRIDRRTAAFVEAAAPDVIYSPMSGIRMMRLGERLSRLTGAPLVPHLLDDWPTTLYENHELGGRAQSTMAGLLETTLRRARGIGVISEAMAEEYQRRYGVTSTPLMNCVDSLGTPKAADTEPVRFAYVGGLHLGRARLLTEIADAVEQTPGAELLVHAPQDDLHRHRSLFAGFSAVRYGPSLEIGEVPGALAGADVLVHLESFDEATARYTRLSISTKIPQYLAAARPVLALGPGTLASMHHLQTSGAALVVDATVGPGLVEAVAGLTDSPTLRRSLGEAGVRFAAAHHHGNVVRARLASLLCEATR